MKTKCGECGNTFSGNICTCGWKKEKYQSATAVCSECKRLFDRSMLFAVGKHERQRLVCLHDWKQLQVKTLAEDLMFWEALAEEYAIPLEDLPIHARAAEAMGVDLATYIAGLPKNKDEFMQQFKGTKYEGIFS